jgi:hypothetical protein
MNQARKICIVILIILTGFLALTGLLGGIALLAGINTPPLRQLEGSMFKDFTVPGAALVVFVGGSGMLATLMLIRKNRFAVLLATLTGIIIMFFEFVEVLVIGSPPGIARTLQIFYFGLGTFITGLSISIWFIDLFSGKNCVQSNN